MTKFALILYMNRSGSTFLSRRISELGDDICVLPEMKFLLELLQAREDGRVLRGAELLTLMKRDPRSDALGLTDEDFAAITETNSSDDIASLLASIARCKLKKKPSLVVFKLNTLIYYRRHLENALPGLTFIHIVRDPRAVVNSMLRTPIPEKPGFNMARGSAIYAAKSWREYIKALQGESEKYLTIKYEILEDNFDGFVREFSNCVGVEFTQTTGEARYNIASLDKDLHGNVFQDFRKDRLDAWREELKQSDVASIEHICRVEMRKFGYFPVNNSDSGNISRLFANLRHQKAMAINSIRTLYIYTRRKGGVSELFKRLKLARRPI